MRVLDAIRLLIKAEGRATRSGIKQVAPSLSHRHIAETIAANSEYLQRDNRGAITQVQLHKPLHKMTWETWDEAVIEDNLWIERRTDMIMKHPLTYRTPHGAYSIRYCHYAQRYIAQSEEVTGDGDPNWMFAEGSTIEKVIEEIDENLDHRED